MRHCLHPILALLLAAGAGCSAIPEETYFTLAYSLRPPAAGERPVAGTLRVRDLDVSPAYDKDRIVYRFSPYQFQYYNYMLWAVKPNKMVTDLLARHLGHAGVFEAVQREYADSPPEFELAGMLEAIEELDSGDEWFAHLVVVLQLIRRADGRTVWTKRIDAQKRVYNKQPVYVVRAISELLEEELDAACQELRTVMARARPPAEDAP
ncbi:MAG TPA: ABC-type transport auxiliary lipoprotein family protein [Myxococcota bacterium]|nr:ABC-type transport auxiliary lipoprotein family protein [Myxococcota bacterium]